MKNYTPLVPVGKSEKDGGGVVKKHRRGFDPFDGSKLCKGKSYRTYKNKERLRRLIVTGKCPHPSIMVTLRCQHCGLICVKIATDRGTIELLVAHKH